MGKVLLLFSESRLIRLIGPLVPQKLAGIQDEWYSASETLIGLVGSACRLRPEDRDAFLDWGRRFAQSEMPKFADDILRGLERPRGCQDIGLDFVSSLVCKGNLIFKHLPFADL